MDILNLFMVMCLVILFFVCLLAFTISLIAIFKQNNEIIKSINALNETTREMQQKLSRLW